MDKIHTEMRFTDELWKVKNYNFENDEELYKCILLANSRNETLNITLKIKEKVYYITNWDLYF